MNYLGITETINYPLAQGEGGGEFSDFSSVISWYTQVLVSEQDQLDLAIWHSTDCLEQTIRFVNDPSLLQLFSKVHRFPPLPATIVRCKASQHDWRTNSPILVVESLDQRLWIHWYWLPSQQLLSEEILGFGPRREQQLVYELLERELHKSLSARPEIREMDLQRIAEAVPKILPSLRRGISDFSIKLTEREGETSAELYKRYRQLQEEILKAVQLRSGRHGKVFRYVFIGEIFECLEAEGNWLGRLGVLPEAAIFVHRAELPFLIQSESGWFLQGLEGGVKEAGQVTNTENSASSQYGIGSDDSHGNSTESDFPESHDGDFQDNSHFAVSSLESLNLGRNSPNLMELNVENGVIVLQIVEGSPKPEKMELLQADNGGNRDKLRITWEDGTVEKLTLVGQTAEKIAEELREGKQISTRTFDSIFEFVTSDNIAISLAPDDRASFFSCLGRDDDGYSIHRCVEGSSSLKANLEDCFKQEMNVFQKCGGGIFPEVQPVLDGQKYKIAGEWDTLSQYLLERSSGGKNRNLARNLFLSILKVVGYYHGGQCNDSGSINLPQQLHNIGWSHSALSYLRPESFLVNRKTSNGDFPHVILWTLGLQTGSQSIGTLIQNRYDRYGVGFWNTTGTVKDWKRSTMDDIYSILKIWDWMMEKLGEKYDTLSPDCINCLYDLRDSGSSESLNSELLNQIFRACRLGTCRAFLKFSGIRKELNLTRK